MSMRRRMRSTKRKEGEKLKRTMVGKKKRR